MNQPCPDQSALPIASLQLDRPDCVDWWNSELIVRLSPEQIDRTFGIRFQ